MYFGRYKESFPRNLAFLDADPQFALRVIDFGTIKVMVAESDSCLDSLDDFAVNRSIVPPFVPGSSGPVPELIWLLGGS